MIVSNEIKKQYTHFKGEAEREGQRSDQQDDGSQGGDHLHYSHPFRFGCNREMPL